MWLPPKAFLTIYSVARARVLNITVASSRGSAVSILASDDIINLPVAVHSWYILVPHCRVQHLALLDILLVSHLHLMLSRQKLLVSGARQNDTLPLLSASG